VAIPVSLICSQWYHELAAHVLLTAPSDSLLYTRVMVWAISFELTMAWS
jgi:hypothetical protein